MVGIGMIQRLVAAFRGTDKREAAASLLIDYLSDQSRPSALRAPFDEVLAEPTAWTFASPRLLSKLPLTPEQRNLYDSVSIAECVGATLYLVEAGVVWFPDPPVVPRYLLLAREGSGGPALLGTLEKAPEHWTFTK